MKQANSIVRTKTIHKNVEENYYEIELMTFEKYVSKSAYFFYDTVFELYPYKWYDIRWINDKSYYYISNTFSNKNDSNLNIKSKNSLSIKLVLFIVETVAAWVIIRAIASIVSLI